MSLKTAQSLALNLAHTLMVIVVVIRTEDGFFVLPSDELDGETVEIVREYDPFA